jgi:acetyl esterase/lipase
MKIKILIIILFCLFIAGCQDNICGDGICSEDETLENCKSDCEIKIDDLDFSTNNSAVFNSITGNVIYQKDKCSVHSCNNCKRNDLCNKLKNLLLSYYKANNTLNNINNKLIKYPDSASKEILVNEIEVTQTKISNFFSYYYPVNLDTLSSEDFEKGKLDVSNIDKELQSIKNKIISFIKHGTLCGNKICNSIETNSDKIKQESSLDEKIKNLPKDCGCPPSDTPVCGVDEKTYSSECWAKCHDVQIDYKGKCVSKFGMHAGSQNMTENNILKSSARIMAPYSVLEKHGVKTFVQTLDKLYLDNNYGVIISFVSDKVNFKHNYLLLDENSLEYWKKVVYRIVERYDGDSDFGCLIGNKKDCYNLNDNLYPEKKLNDMILTRPIKHWQIENEWTWQILYKNLEKVKIEDLISHMSEISSEIKKADSDSKILMSGFVGLQVPFLYQQKKGFIERGTPDCNYKKTYYDNLNSTEKKWVKDEYDKTLYLIKNAADYYDIIDFHFYGNDPELLVNFTKFLNNLLAENNLIDKEYWVLEAASPFYFFNLISPQNHNLPHSRCIFDLCEEYDNSIYDENIHSANLIKMYIFGLSSGVKKMFYSTLKPLCHWDENYARLSLMDLEGNKKLAYFTYKLMTDKISDYESLERIYLINNDSNDYIYEAKVDNKSVFIAWTKSNNHSVDMTEYFQGDVNITTLFIDKTSKERIIKTTKSSDIEISNSPIFIEEYNSASCGGSICDDEELTLSKEFIGKEIQFKSNGVSVIAYVSKPEGIGPFPAVVLVHGGKSSNEAARILGSSAHAKKLVENGYITLSVNYRDDPTQEKSVKDVISGVEFLKNQEVVNNNIAIFGSSHGAYIAMMTSIKLGNEVKAIVNNFGPTDMIKMYNERLVDDITCHSDLQNAEFTNTTETYFGGAPNENNKELYQSISPIYNVDKIKAPVLIIHGEGDCIIPIENHAYPFEKALKDNGKIVEVKYYKQGHHGFIYNKNNEALDAAQVTLDFLEKHLKLNFCGDGVCDDG